MATIDTLAIQFSTPNAKKAVETIQGMAQAVRGLAQGLQGIETSKLDSFANAMGVLKSNAPTDNQAKNMKSFAEGVSQLSAAVNGANLTAFATDIANISNGAQGLGARATNKITNLVAGLAQAGQQAQAVANTVQNASAKISANTSNTGSPSLGSSNDVVASLDKVASRVDTIKNKFKGIIVPKKQFKSLEEQAEKVARDYEKLRTKMQEALNSGEVTVDSSKYQNWQRDLEGIRNEYDRLIQKQKELALEGGGFKINPTITTAVKEFGKGFSFVTNIVKNGFNAAMRAASSHIKSLVGHAKNAASSLKKTATSGFKATDMAKKLSKELFRVAKMLKLMITRMALRKVIEEVGNGFKSLALHCKTFDDNVSNLINSSKKLGYSFAGMLEPLINALAPALLYIIELITRAVNALNQLFSALGGGTIWHKAKDFTGSWSDSIKEANKNAKELKKTVLGFDELNQLTDNKNSGSGGNGITDMFEDVPIDPKWMDFAKWLKDMWAKGDFYDLGKLWGEKLRDFLESIPWEEIRDTANKLGKSLASLINGFVEVERLAFDIGYTIAQGINTVFEFLNGFVHELHWDSIGKFIAELFNGFFETIDWELIKDTVVTGMAGIAEAIQNFIDTFHWDNISTFIINAVDTIVSGIKAFVEGINWGDLGKKIGDQLTKTIKGINWREVGQTLGEVLEAIIDFAYEFFSQLDANDIVKAVTDFLHGVFEKVDSEKLGQTLAKVFNLVVDSVKGIWKENKSNIAKEIGGFLKGLFEEIDKTELAKVIGGVLIAAFAAGLVSLRLALIKMFAPKLIAEALFGSAGAAGAAGAGAAGASGSGTLIGSATVAGSSIAAGLVGGITAFLVGSEVGKKVGELIFPDDKELYEKYEGVKGTFQLYGDFFRTLGEEIADHVGQAWDKVKEKTGELKETVGQKLKDVESGFGDFKLKVVGKIDEVKASISDFKDNASEKLKSFNDSVAEKVNNVKEKFGELDANIKEKKDRIVESFASLDEKAKEKFESLKTKITEFGEKWSERWADAKTKLDEFKENASTTLENLKEDFTSFKDKIAEAFSKENWTFSGVVDGLKETFTDAKDAVKGIWNSISDGLSGDYEIGSKKFSVKIPKFTYATGGFPEDGIFFANHNELVGEFSNGKTAVANNAQIVQGIQNGVYNAVVSAMSQQSGNNGYISNEIIIDGEVVARSITKAQEKRNMRYSPQTV